MAGRTENIKVALLIVFHDLLGNLGTGTGTDDGCKARSRTVHKLNPAFTQDNVVGRSYPDFAGFKIRIFVRMVKVGILDAADGFFDFIR